MITPPGTAPLLRQLTHRPGGEATPLHFAATPEEAVALLRATPSEGLLLQLDERVAELLTGLPAALASRVVLLADPETGMRNAERMQPPVGALLFRKGSFSAEELATALSKFERGDLFGLDKYLSCPLQETELVDSSWRGNSLALIAQHFSSLGLDQRTVNQALTVADEFITNAFYNAPVDGLKRPLYSHLSRLDLVRCPERPIRLTYGADDTHIGIAVQDGYGSFAPRTLLHYLGCAFEPAQGRFSTSGAGLGLATALRCSSQLIFNMVACQSTECIGLIRIGPYRQFVEMGKACQIFFQSPEAGP